MTKFYSFELRIKDLYFTQRQIYWIIIHLIGMVVTGIVWAHLIDNYPRLFEIPFTVGGWVVIGIILFSLLDYLDVIKYRKSHERYTKCIICDRTSKVNKFTEKTRVVTDVRRRGSDEYDEAIDKETTTDRTTVKEKPETPLHGIIVYDKMICIECAKKIQRMFEN